MSVYKGDKLVAGGLYEKDVYSTGEVKTNKVWIDGKPIYRKCGFIQNIPANTEYTLDSTLTKSQIDSVIQTGGCATQPEGGIISIGGYNGSEYRACLNVVTDGIKFMSSKWQFTNINWWIEYTKTTD